MLNRFLIALLFGSLPCRTSADDLILASPFGDHMVLQRDRPIHIWGDAPPNASIELQLASQKTSTTASPDGRWSAVLKPLAAGGPYTLTATARNKSITINDILIGDVWLCAGQSNMAMMLKECDGGPAAAASAAKFKNLRLCTVGRGASPTPRTAADIRWRPASPKAAQNFSAVAYFFATYLLANPPLGDVPLGVVDSSFGGSRCEAWIPKESLADFPKEELRPSLFGIAPSTLYNAMIAPLGPSAVKGVLWYQGESNSDRPAFYPKLLGALASSWRAQFQDPALPFIIVGLPDWYAGADGLSWAWLREAQSIAARTIPNMHLAVGINSTDGFDLHPKQKFELGRRAALLAFHHAYGRPDVATGPTFKTVGIEGDALRLTFETSGVDLAAIGGGPPRGFAIAGLDGKYFSADAKIDGNAVILKSRHVREPKTVRYAWAGVPDATLPNRFILPAAPFRTDALPPPDVDVQKRPTARYVRTKAYEATIDAHGSVVSLGVGGKQFLSNALNGAGGTSLPGWLGPRALADVREPGPGQISCSDGQMTLYLVFNDRSMEWTVSNRTKDPTKFRIGLAPQVNIDGRAPSPLTLTRGPASLTVTGVDATTTSDDGPVLETNILGNDSKKLTLAVPEKKPPTADKRTATKALSRIRISADRKGFVLGETSTPFVPFGFNYLGLHGRLSEEDWHTPEEWKRIENDFREMKKLGANVVRWHLQFETFMAAPGRPKPEAIALLKKLLGLAHENGVYLDLTGLNCYRLKRIPAWYDALSESDRWSAQAVFWEAIARACANRPEVFCYDLVNEPVVGDPKPGEHPWVTGELGGFHFVQRICNKPAGRDSKDVAAQWVSKLVAAIRKHDQQSLTTVGVIPWSQVWPGAKPVFYSPGALPHLDFVSVHFYPSAGKLEMDLAALGVYELGKPLVIEETFPLNCSFADFDKFFDAAKPRVAGWVAHYFGHTPAEHRAGAEPAGKLVAEFLDSWQRKARLIADQEK